MSFLSRFIVLLLDIQALVQDDQNKVAIAKKFSTPLDMGLSSK